MEISKPLRSRKRRSTSVVQNITKKCKSDKKDSPILDEVIKTSKAKRRLTKKVLNNELEFGKEFPRVKRQGRSDVAVKGVNNTVNHKGQLISNRKKESDNSKAVKNETISLSPTTTDYNCEWRDAECLAQTEGLSLGVGETVINLLKQEHTIPFIARYRSNLTGDLRPDKLRKIKATYEYIQNVHRKASQLIKQITALGLATPDLISSIQSAQNLEVLDFLGAPFKKGGKRTLAARARELGLDEPAALLLEKDDLDFNKFVNPKNPDLDGPEKVILGIQHIISDIISKSSELHNFFDKISSSESIQLKSKLKEPSDGATGSSSKYQLYGDFASPITRIRSHQILAINRGESEKQLSVKVLIPDFLWKPLKRHCLEKWLRPSSSPSKRRVIRDAVDDAIKRLLRPLLVRRIRAKLNEIAENQAIETFESNLRQLLMAPPCIGKVIMGIDPGFRNGCKVAVISNAGNPLVHDKFYLHHKQEAEKKLVKMINLYECQLIALGNGVGCRETEVLLSDIIKKKAFGRDLQYTIINEQAVSIYSCGSVASEEFPNLDPTVVSAISIARRLQNPLSELVKVEPKHLGVGMYQHDVKEKKLTSALDEIVSECVSFVGVDVNTASFYLLQRVAGLNGTKAREIIKYRSENCTFKNREDLMKVKGIKSKTFQQCAGFLRIVPATARCNRQHLNCGSKFNPLDETPIHPESYETAFKVIDRFGVTPDQLGATEFVNAVKKQMTILSPELLAAEFRCSVLTMAFIVETLMQPKHYDLRSVFTGPVFLQKIKTLEEIRLGQVLEGVVRNIVTFGSFVDVGVGVNGLIHKSEMRNAVLQLNDRVQVQVISVEMNVQKLGLRLLHVGTRMALPLESLLSVREEASRISLKTLDFFQPPFWFPGVQRADDPLTRDPLINETEARGKPLWTPYAPWRREKDKYI